MFVACPILYFAAPFLMRTFTPDPDVIEIGVSYLRIDGFILPIYMMLFAINSFLHGAHQVAQKLITTGPVKPNAAVFTSFPLMSFNKTEGTFFTSKESDFISCVLAKKGKLIKNAINKCFIRC